MGIPKIHAKTTLLSSLIIIVAILMAALVLTSAAIANIERTDDQTLAETQARDLAQHISDIGTHDPEALTRAANLIKGSRPTIVSVRVWQLSQGDFTEKTAAAGSAPATPIPDDTKNILRHGPGPTVVKELQSDSNQSLYRAFAIIIENGRPTGGVEIVERFDSCWAVAFRYLRKVIWMSLIVIALILVGTFFLFRQLQLTTRLETEQEILRDRVREATIELEKRNQQL